ncbi:thiol:disulfide interchange protein DsbC [Bisgaardia hudsonensis]|uniref:Thiol:disulfide interchange protein n=1 Tax=Bisgaardia hudsonensis TaxID=109472 RepID=A0A4R2N2K9_9PAST|nr:bifunctional protein-disulfide isomerase/oxidoreductase DsbC [Bisgaardia hudsonensis]QLB12550.1 bifunctional protein-disulfide isomerase/oxidoreductase DsbC [Bisgaardia hudsonensis]TCP14091.1 thiol:disulfide interchange protein DsbC [Bisgaardia hudsonensis]
MKKNIITLSLLLTSSAIFANDTAIKESLKKLGASDIEVSNSPIKGIKTAVTDSGVLYVSEDGKYVLHGSLYEITDNGPIDLTGKALVNKLNNLKNEMIIYPAKNEKHVVTVFMDISCYYCQKLHKEMKEYNDLGITVRYLAFPRSGLDTKTAKQMESIWTAKDPIFALNEAENGNLPTNLKAADKIKKHYELGVQFGVRGTPSIITSKGEVIGGYLKPEELLEALEHNQ